ncbi:unnamed protein product [Paramecium sonneborni]|uniref:Uncharacterized protein n=1 Tax=Paramecium sonneborni TaxID=65129 RepID=A0A8S1L0B6_9CILI|nr:unnamed protein product [Paramecium sonneborni]
MGNICQQSNQIINQKEKVIRLTCNPNKQGPNKQILHRSIKNLSQNLDTFEEDFYKNEFFFDFSNDNKAKSCLNNNDQNMIIMNEVEEKNIIQFPSFEYLSVSQIQYKTNVVPIKEDPLNFAFIKEKKKKDVKFLKNFKKPVPEKNHLKSILKQKKSNCSSFSSFSDRYSKYSVSFNILPSNNSKSARSLSPIIYTTNNIKSEIKPQSMIFMQQFPYI